MAGPEVGTAYVRIKAITAGLGGDISDAVARGVKDAGPDIQKAGERAGGDYVKGVTKALDDGEIGDGVVNAWDPPDASKRVSSAGVKHTEDYSDGVQKESKRRSPFRALTDVLRKLTPNMSKAGASHTEAYGDGVDEETKRRNPFTSIFKSLEKIGDAIPMGGAGLWTKALALPFLGDAANIIGSLLAGATAAIGFLAQAAAGAGVAMAGMFALAVPGFAVLLAALKTNTEELEAFKEEAAELGEPFKEIAVATQRTLFPFLLRSLKTMQQMIPMFANYGQELGGVVGKWIEVGAAMLTTDENMGRINSLLMTSVGFFDLMGEAAVHIVDALLPFFQAAAPLALQLAESINRMAKRFSEFMGEEGRTEALTATFQKWYDKLVIIAGIIGDLAVGLWNILSIAGDSDMAGDMFGGLAEAAQSFRDWTVDSAADIQAWFDTSQPLFDEVWGLLTDIADIVIGPVFDNTGIEGTTEFVRTIREDWLPIFERLGDVLSGDAVRDAIIDLADAFVGLLEATAGGGSFTAFLDSLTWALQTFADLMSNPIMKEIAPILFSIIGALKLLSLLKLGTIAGGLVNLVGGFMGLASASGTMATLGGILASPALVAAAPIIAALAVAVGLLAAVWYFWDDISAALAPVVDWFSKLNPVLKVFVAVVGAVLLVMNPLAWAIGIVALIKNWDEVLPVIEDVGQAISDFFTAIPELIAGIPEMLAGVATAIGDFFTGLPEMLAGLPEAIGEALNNLGTTLKEKLLAGLRALPGAVLEGIGALWEIGENILGYIADGLARALPAMAEFFVGLPIKIINWLGIALAELLDIGVTVIKFIVEGLVTALPEIITFFLKLPFEIATLIRRGIVSLVRLGLQMLGALLQGIEDAWPALKQWFLDLPGNILSIFNTAIDWLWNVGGDIIDGLWQGIQESWDTIRTFFIDLPGKVIGWFLDAATWLLDVGRQLMNGMWEGIQEVFASFSEFFGGLPQQIVDWVVANSGLIISIGSSVINWIIEGITSIVQTLWDWFINFPSLAFNTVVGVASSIIDIGSSVINWILEGIASLVSTLWAWFTAFPGAAFDTVVGMASSIIDIGSSVINWILDGIDSIVSTLWAWFTAFPGAAYDTVVGMLDSIVDIGRDAIGWIVDGLVEVASDLWDWFRDLPGDAADKVLSTDFVGIGKDIIDWIIDGLDGMARQVGNAMQSALSSAASNLNPVNLAGKLWSGLTGANGGIFTRATNITIGEAGTEALIPVTRPARAMSLMHSVGLDRMVLNAYSAVPAAAATSTAATRGGEVTMLHIDKAQINEPVDADLIVQKITSAYRRLAS